LKKLEANFLNFFVKLLGSQISSVVQPNIEQMNSNLSLHGELTDVDDLAEPVIITNFSEEYEGKSEVKNQSVRPQQKQRRDMTDFGEGVPQPATIDGSEQKTMMNKTLSLSDSDVLIMHKRHSDNKSPSMPPVPTPGEETAGNLENEASSSSVVEESYMAAQTQTPGGEVELGELGHKFPSTPGAIESSSVDSEIDLDEIIVLKKGGDCDRIYIHRFSLLCCSLTLLAFIIVCFIYYPKPVELCLNLSLDDEEIMEKVLNDEGGYLLNITNPNSIDVHIHGLEITAYYGGVAKENGLLNTEKMDYYIPAHRTLSKNQTYTFTQNCTAAIPITTLNGCFYGYRAYMIYDIVISFKACVLSFVCHEGIVSKSDYKSDCSENDMVCTELEFFQF